MKYNDFLNEGLHKNDLQHLVKSIISIDEFNSKLDDNSIVVGFYVSEYDAAKDLNRFIQKGSTPILDTDISPSPTQDGDYVVFVEIFRDKNFPSSISKLITDINNLTGNVKWKFTAYKVKGKKDFNEENIKKYIRL